MQASVQNGVTTASVSHIPQLDGLRAISIAIVMIAHAGLDRIVPGGLGVMVFFFLSGFLITTLMRSEQQKTGTVSISEFYVRRTLRIIPPMWITLTICVLLILAGVSSRHADRHLDIVPVVAQYLFLTNYVDLLGYTGSVPNMPLWSLAVEEHFYLIFPLFYILILSRLSNKSAFRVCVALCLAFLSIRIAHLAWGTRPEAIYYWSHTRIDSILAGSCLALYRNPVLDGKQSWSPGGPTFCFALLIILSTLVIRNEIFRQSLRYSLQSFALFFIFAYVLNDKKIISKILTLPVIRVFGIYSYSLYLSHFFLLLLIQSILPKTSSIWIALIAYAVAFGYAAAMYRFVERPMATLRRRFHRTDAAATLVSLPTEISERRKLI